MPEPLVAYCDTADLIIGDIPLQAGVSDSYVVNAALEIDSYLAGIYVTPITANLEEDPRGQQTMLVLKKINAHLASGRILTSLAAGGEDNQTHAYGLLLLKQSHEALAQLATGAPDLYGAVKHTVTNESHGRGAVYGTDAYSQVDVFYDTAMPGGIANPNALTPGVYYGGG